jgi:hypothetical protein
MLGGMLTEKDGSINAERDPHLAQIDKLTAKVDAMGFGPSAVARELSLHEEWIKKLAEKAGVALEY